MHTILAAIVSVVATYNAFNGVFASIAKVMLERPDTWKKVSAVSQASASDGTMAVKLQRTYYCNDEDETEVERDNVAKGQGDMCACVHVIYGLLCLD